MYIFTNLTHYGIVKLPL